MLKGIPTVLIILVSSLLRPAPFRKADRAADHLLDLIAETIVSKRSTRLQTCPHLRWYSWLT